jgi:hypothetical protein
MTAIQRDLLLDDYYANLHGAYNSMRDCFSTSGKNQDDIAVALDVDKSLISRRMNGSENLTLRTLSYMGTAMGCRLSITFVPYAQVGMTNSYTLTPAATFTGTPATPSANTPSANTVNTSTFLETA